MSSRGHFIGQIIDDLDSIASQVRQRCKLGHIDLNRVLEDFFKELLNLVYSINLRNLNNDRSNAPGIDLGDKAARIAYQITSQAKSQKINDTLRKIVPDDATAFECIRVLVIGEGQEAIRLTPILPRNTNFQIRTSSALLSFAGISWTLSFRRFRPCIASSPTSNGGS